jgi:hypothetical protein
MYPEFFAFLKVNNVVIRSLFIFLEKSGFHENFFIFIKNIIMKILYPLAAVIILFIAVSCNSKSNDKEEKHKKTLKAEVPELKISIDSTDIALFYQTYPKLVKFQGDVSSLYKKKNATQLWLDNKGVVEFGSTLFNKYKNLGDEGLKTNFPYNEKINPIFERLGDNKLSQVDTDLMITNLYFYYAEKVYGGVDEKTTTSLEWLLPRKKLNYQVFSDSIFKHATINDDNKSKMFSQYYKLREALKQYRSIEKKGGWKTIEVDEDFKSFKVGDSATAIAQIRDRLAITGELKENNKSIV